MAPSAGRRTTIPGWSCPDAHSDGQAAYADRTMDGVKFTRDNVGLKFEKSRISPLVEKVEAQVFYNYVDHVMDNYSLRPVSGNKMVSNPDRETVGGRAAIGLRLAEATKATLGVDYQTNKHTLRSTMNQATMPFENMARAEDANFRNYGLFGELTHYLGERDKLIAGLRADNWNAQDKRGATVDDYEGILTNGMPIRQPGKERSETLTSGFGRYEHDLAGTPATLYAGLGHTERFPDYWELISATKESLRPPERFQHPSGKDQPARRWARLQQRQADRIGVRLLQQDR